MMRPFSYCVGAYSSQLTKILPHRRSMLTVHYGPHSAIRFLGEALKPEIVDSFWRSYPFHPEVLDTLTGEDRDSSKFPEGARHA